MLSENYGYSRPLYSQPLSADTSQYLAFKDFLNDEKLRWSKEKREDSRSPYQRRAANERERKRMHSINKGFDCLRERLPIPRYAHAKKLSKVETLKNAIDYICYLSNMLERDFSESDIFEVAKPQRPEFDVVLRDPRTTSLQTSDPGIRVKTRKF
ncbi:hypothetical protein FO519_000722 [Halicephalobus sp. NKZ332]|nr:hypothetical protein FO519_000722 [Halicephalobus sp. NKZ332]